MNAPLLAAVAAMASAVSGIVLLIVSWRAPHAAATLAEELRKVNEKSSETRRLKLYIFAELLKARGMFTEGHWYWICVLALFGFSLVFNICFMLALTFLTRKSSFLTPIKIFIHELICI